MTEHDFSNVIQLGRTKFIVNCKQSENAKKPLEQAFRDMCKHEVLGDSFVVNSLTLEKMQKTS